MPVQPASIPPKFNIAGPEDYIAVGPYKHGQPDVLLHRLAKQRCTAFSMIDLNDSLATALPDGQHSVARAPALDLPISRLPLSR